MRTHRITAQIHLAAAALGMIFAAIYTRFSWVQWTNWVIPSWDLGIFTQLAKAYAAFEQPIVSIKGYNFNLWGDHFHPILVVLGPIYKMFPSPFTLLVVQNLLAGLSIYLLMVLAARLMHWGFALALSIAYALSFGIQQAVAVQFHEVAFAIPFLVLSLGHLVRAQLEQKDKHLVRATLWAVLLVLVKEDMGLTVVVISAVALTRSGWFARAFTLVFPVSNTSQAAKGLTFRAMDALALLSIKGGARASALLMLWGIAATLLSVAVILPFFNVGGVFDYSGNLDVKGALADPLQSFALMFYPWQKTLTLSILLITGALLWVVSPLALVALPTVVWRFLATNEGYYRTDWHYSLVLMPIVFCALIDVIVTLKKRHEASNQKSVSNRENAASARVEKSSDASGGFSRVKTQLARRADSVLPLAALAIALAFAPNQPLMTVPTNVYESESHQQQLSDKKQALASIPANTTVASDLSLLTYLIPDHEVYWIGNTQDPAPEYVVIDQTNSAWGANPVENPVQFAADTYQQAYAVYAQYGTVYVMKRM